MNWCYRLVMSGYMRFTQLLSFLNRFAVSFCCYIYLDYNGCKNDYSFLKNFFGFSDSKYLQQKSVAGVLLYLKVSVDFGLRYG